MKLEPVVSKILWNPFHLAHSLIRKMCMETLFSYWDLELLAVDKIAMRFIQKEMIKIETKNWSRLFLIYIDDVVGFSRRTFYCTPVFRKESPVLLLLTSRTTIKEKRFRWIKKFDHNHREFLSKNMSLI